MREQKEETYAKLYFERDGLTLTLLNKDMPNTVRELITSEQARELLEQTKNWDGEAKTQWKARADTHQAAIEGGDPFEYARAAKELTKLESRDTLRYRDKANLDHSLNLLIEEFACTLNKTPNQAGKLIRQAIGDI